MGDKLRLLTPGTVRLDSRSNPTPGGWLSSGGRRVRDARERLGYSQAAQTSSLYESPASHYSFYKQHRQLLPDQYWSLYKSSPDVRACVDSIARRIATWDWVVKPTVDPRDAEEYTRLAEEADRVAKFLRVPNSNGETWQEVLTRTITDLLVYDAGIVELVDDSQGDLQELVSWLGSEWFRVIDTHGHLLHYDQSPENSSESPIKVPAERVLHFSLFPNNRSTHGLPLLESCITECLTVILSSEHSMLALDADEIPPGLLVLGGVAGAAAERARADLQSMRGKDHRVRVITSPEPSGIEARWVELRHTMKDLELLQVVDTMRRAIWRVFGVQPVELGDTAGVPRASAEVQVDVSSSHLITPILESIQAKINAQVLPRLLSPEDVDRVVFTFQRGMENTPDQNLRVAQSSEILLKRGVLTVNEVRQQLGYLPVEGGDVPTVETSLGPVPLTAMAAGQSPGMTLPSSVYGDADDQYPGTYRSKLEELSPEVRKTLEEKAEAHNDEVRADWKRTTPSVLAEVFARGVGAYHTNPESVRPTVSSPEQWAFARVNSFLYALKNERFRSGKHDTDLMPEDHPLSTKGESSTDEEESRARYDGIDFSPPQDARVELARGLRWYEEGHGGDGLVPDTIRWARRLARGENITPDKARKMRAWLARHEVDKQAEGFRPGEDGYPSPGRVAWALWAGDPGVRWSNSLVAQLDRADAEAEDGRACGPGCSHPAHHHEDVGSLARTWVSLHPRSMVAQVHTRAARTWLPSDWQPEGRFRDVRTLDLGALAELIAGYTRGVARLYEDTALECTGIVASAYGRDGSITVQDSQVANRRIGDALDALSVKWGSLAEGFYLQAADLGVDAAREWMTTEPEVDSQAEGRAYYQQAMEYLTDSRGLIGTLRDQLSRLVSNSTLARSLDTEIDEITPATPARLSVAMTASTFAVNSHRITNWTGKLVGLANLTLARSLESVMALEAGPDGQERPVVWFYEWVSAGGRSCPICAAEGVQGFRRMDRISRYPGEDTYCGGNCRCVLVMWKESEVRSGAAVPLSTPAGEVSSNPLEDSYLPPGMV